MKYITKKNTETGKKLKFLIDRANECREIAKDLATKHGFQRWRDDYYVLGGGISSLADPKKEIDKKVWGKGAAEGEYMPKGNTKVGKQIREEINSLPTVSFIELNRIVGYEEHFSNIGINWNGEYFGISVQAEWDTVIPEDMEEVLESKYIEIFNQSVTK